MKKKTLASLLQQLQQGESLHSRHEIININELLGASLKKGGYGTLNQSCVGGFNVSCMNFSCPASSNVSCWNL
jgi:hypothetical protein